MSHNPVIIIGAGAAGMMCAIEASKRGRGVLILDHLAQAGKKISITGGGRCNFTNREVTPAHYVSKNPHFCKSALSRYPPESFIQKVQEHQILFEERALGRLFCVSSAHEIVTMLKKECQELGVRFEWECKIGKVSQKNFKNPEQVFEIQTNKGCFTSESLVIATGGLSLPKIGATDLGYVIARQFGLKIVPPVPALDGFVFDTPETQPLCALAGISVKCRITCNQMTFQENILFTHTGLSGPGALQASLHWNPGCALRIDLLPEIDLLEYLLKEKKKGNRTLLKNQLKHLLPERLVHYLCKKKSLALLPLTQISEKELKIFSPCIQEWKIIPSKTVGYTKAEVTRGGVDTVELSSQTMESKKISGLYFIGEVLDVTGWLGGYNLHWAWASGWVAGQVV